MAIPRQIRIPHINVPHVRVRYLLMAAGVSTIICIGGLRHNNLRMSQLREAVYAADKDNGDVSGTLSRLQYYVTSHMNTDLTPSKNSVYPPIQLKYTYERLQAAANEKAGANSGQIYSDAQAYCEQQNSSDFSGRNRVPCIQNYVKSNGAAVPEAVPDSLYKFDFVSPSWSPDVAGWSMLVSIWLVLTGLAILVKRLIRKVIIGK